jgi:hypothetical protein
MKYSRDLSRPLAESKMDADRSLSRRGKSRAAKTQYDNKVAPVGLKVPELSKYKDANNYSYLKEKRYRKQINKSK